jgi:hypothetical protein
MYSFMTYGFSDFFFSFLLLVGVGWGGVNGGTKGPCSLLRANHGLK